MQPCRCGQCELRRLTERVIDIHTELRARNDMALEIKGLKGKALKAGAVFDRLNRAYDKLIETGDAHASDVEGLAPQIEAMQDDINFAVQTLGNSVGGSSDGGTKTPIEPVVLVPETATPLPNGSAAPSEPVHE